MYHSTNGVGTLSGAWRSCAIPMATTPDSITPRPVFCRQCNAPGFCPRPHRGEIFLVRHLVEGRDGQPLGRRGDAAADSLSDDRAGCPHECPELGVVELVGVEHAGHLCLHRDQPEGECAGSEDRRRSGASVPARLPSRGGPPLRTALAGAAPHRPRSLSRRPRSGTVRGHLRWSRAIDAQAFLGLRPRPRSASVRVPQ